MGFANSILYALRASATKIFPILETEKKTPGQLAVKMLKLTPCKDRESHVWKSKRRRSATQESRRLEHANLLARQRHAGQLLKKYAHNRVCLLPFQRRRKRPALSNFPGQQEFPSKTTYIHVNVQHSAMKPQHAVAHILDRKPN